MKCSEYSVLINGLIYVVLIALHKRLGWIFGIIGCVAQVYVSSHAHLWFDAVLNVVYVVMGIQGFLFWQEHPQEMVAQHLSKREWFNYGLIGVLASFILYVAAVKMGNASPWLDAGTTVFSLIATHLTIKKYSENWLFWIVIDAFLTVMFYNQQLFINALLYLIYTFIAAYGWHQWNKQLK